MGLSGGNHCGSRHALVSSCSKAFDPGSQHDVLSILHIIDDSGSAQQVTVFVIGHERRN